MRTKRILPNVLAVTLLAIAPVGMHAQETLFDPEQVGALRWRNIGPNRGGRSIAATGSPGHQRPVYYSTSADYPSSLPAARSGR